MDWQPSPETIEGIGKARMAEWEKQSRPDLFEFEALPVKHMIRESFFLVVALAHHPIPKANPPPRLPGASGPRELGTAGRGAIRDNYETLPRR